MFESNKDIMEIREVKWSDSNTGFVMFFDVDLKEDINKTMVRRNFIIDKVLLGFVYKLRNERGGV